MRILLIKIVALLGFVISSPTLSAHGSYQEHVTDMMEVFGFQENAQIREWMKFISQDMIDKPGSFYEHLKTQFPNFQCKHRLLFHWAYDGKPWSPALEKRVRKYCQDYNLQEDSILSCFQLELKKELSRRNREITKRTNELFNLRSRTYNSFFSSVAYNVHLIGDYTTDNTDLEGLEDLKNIVRSLTNAINRIDPIKGRVLTRKLTAYKSQSFNQSKADELMAFLKKEMPLFVKNALNGSIYRMLRSGGFYLREC